MNSIRIHSFDTLLLILKLAGRMLVDEMHTSHVNLSQIQRNLVHK